MKVLWFEVTVPGRYKNDKEPVGGWQDSLEYIVRQCSEIELYIAFEGIEGMEPKKIEGISYIPLVPHYTFFEKKIKNKYNRWNSANKLVPLAVKAVKAVKPDIIHVFGSEWEFGQVAKYTSIPVVIHMQGCIASYSNFIYPPGFSYMDEILYAGFNLKRQFRLFLENHFLKTYIDLEKSNFKAVKYYMGRTDWDYHLVSLFHPGAKYYYCSEALRPSFVINSNFWHFQNHKSIRLISVGTSGFRKGMDTILKTAYVMMEQNFDFEWFVVGGIGYKKRIEKKNNITFEDNHVKFLGYINSENVKNLLMNSDIFIQTSYGDNSPNSVCEAQYVGIPIIATYVGGVPSLLENGKEGILVPANHPYEMAYQIISLSKDKGRQMKYSVEARKRARQRHNPKKILTDLLACYKNILSIDNG